MFFGKGAPENVGIDGLAGYLEALFEKRLGSMPAGAEAAVAGIRRHQSEFERECKELEALDAEPYTEGLWMPNVNTIKNSKAAYAAALQQVIARMDTDGLDVETVYHRYEGILSSVDRITNEVLRMNATFKSTLYAYSRHMSKIKREFSLL